MVNKPLCVLSYMYVTVFILQGLEDENSQLTSELQARDDLITSAEQTMKQYKHKIAQMEESLALKTDMIRYPQTLSIYYVHNAVEQVSVVHNLYIRLQNILHHGEHGWKRGIQLYMGKLENLQSSRN